MTIGFVKIHRKITDWEWYNDKNTCRIFLHLLITANFEDKKWRGVEIKRGQLLTSLSNLAKSTGLTIQQTRTSISKLQSTHEITIKATKSYTLITLLNYSVYQDRSEKINTQNNTQSNSEITNEQQTDNKQITTTKEGKKYKEGKEDNKYSELVEGLKQIIENKLNKNITTGGWHDEIRKLIEIDLKNRQDARQDVINAIQAVEDNHGEQYFPIIQSAKSLREKFVKIEAYLARQREKGATLHEGQKEPSDIEKMYNHIQSKYQDQ